MRGDSSPWFSSYYIDCDWNLSGVSIALSAPIIQIINDEADEKSRIIDTSGEDAVQFPTRKANNGSGIGISGDHGAHGQPGQSAGNVTIKCDTLIGHLIVKARGGDGADGQDGGDGHAGMNGKDGKDGQLPSKMETFSSYPYPFSGMVPGYNLVAVARSYSIRNKPKKYVDYGGKGTAGTQGGCGGDAGCGGEGGHQGKFVLECPDILGSVVSHQIENGSDGMDGQPGNGGDGGSGGRNGFDIARVFELDDLNPIFEVTGNGSLTVVI